MAPSGSGAALSLLSVAVRLFLKNRLLLIHRYSDNANRVLYSTRESLK